MKLSLIEHLCLEHVAAPPVIRGSHMYLAFYDGTYKCIDTSSGKTVWETNLDTRIEDLDYAGSALVNDKYAIVSARDVLLVFDKNTGRKLQQIRDVSADLNYAALSADHKLIADVERPGDDGTHYLWAYDLEKQEELFCKDLDIALPSVITVAGIDFVANKNKVFFIINNDIAKTISLESIGDYTDKTGKQVKSKFTGRLLLEGSTLIVPVNGYHLAGINTKTGVVAWTKKLTIRVPSSVSLSEGYIHLLGDEGVYYRIDPKNGTIITEKELESVFSSISMVSKHILKGDYLFFSDSRKGVLFALNRQTWQVDWEYQCKASTGAANVPLISEGKLFQRDNDGNLYVFEGL